MNERRWAYVPAGSIGGPPKAPPPPELLAQYAKQRGTGMLPVKTPTHDMERQARPMSAQNQQLTTQHVESSSQNFSFQHLPARSTLSQECAKMDDELRIDSRQRADFVQEQQCGRVAHSVKPETIVRAHQGQPHSLRSNRLFDCRNKENDLGQGDKSETGAVHGESEALVLSDNVSFRSDASDGTAMDSLESDETLFVGSLDDDNVPQGQRPSVLPKVCKIRNAQRIEALIGSIKTETAMTLSSVDLTTPKTAQAFARVEEIFHTQAGGSTIESERIGAVNHESPLSLSARVSRVKDDDQQDAGSALEVRDTTIQHVLFQRCAGDDVDSNTRSRASDSDQSSQQGSVNNSTQGSYRDVEKHHIRFRAVDRNQHGRLAERTAPKARGPFEGNAAAPHVESHFYRQQCERGPVNMHSVANSGNTPFENDVDNDTSRDSQRHPSLDENQDRQHISLSDIVGLKQADFIESSRRLDLRESRCLRPADCIDEDNDNHTRRESGCRCSANEVADTALEAHDFRPTGPPIRAVGIPTGPVAARDNVEASLDIDENSTYISQTFNKKEHQQQGQHASAPGYQVHSKSRIVHKQPVGAENPKISAQGQISCNVLKGTRTEAAAWLGPVRHGRYDVRSHENAPDATCKSEFFSPSASSSEKDCDDQHVVDGKLVVPSQSVACHDELPKEYEAKVECPHDCSKLTLPHAAAIALSRATLRTQNSTKETQTKEGDDDKNEDSGESASFSSPLRESSSSNASQDTFVTERPEVDNLGAKTRAMIQSYAHLRRAVRDSKEARDVYMATCLDKDAAFRRIFFDLIDHEAVPLGKKSTEAASHESKASGVDGTVILQHPEDTVATTGDGQVGPPKDDQRAHPAIRAEEETWQKDKSIRSSLNAMQSPSWDRLHRLRDVLIEELQRHRGSASSEKKLEAALSELGRAMSSITTRGNEAIYDTRQRLPHNLLACDNYAAHSTKQRVQKTCNSALQQRRSDDLVAIQGEGTIRHQSKLDSPARTDQCVKHDAWAEVPRRRDEFSDLHNSALNEVCGALSILSTDGVWRRRHFRLNIIQRMLKSGRLCIDLARISRVDAPNDVRTFDLVCFDPPGFYKLRAPSVSDRATWLHRLQPSLDLRGDNSRF